MLRWLKTASEKNVKPGLPDLGKCLTPEKEKLTEKLNEVVDSEYVKNSGSGGKKRKRGEYTHYTPETKAKIARYAIGCGPVKAARHFSKIMDCKISESTVRGFKSSYLLQKNISKEDELYQHGFRIIDAVDPSESMLEVAKKKNIYRNYYYEYVTEKPISIPDNTYDGLTMSGALLFGHINCCALPELIRLVKPGGFVVMVTKYANLETVEEYKGRFLVKMDQLEEDGQWKKVKIEKFDNYHLGKEGVVIVYQIC